MNHTPRLIRATGAEEPIRGDESFAELERLLGADCCDTVNLRNGWTMVVDDVGHQKRLPVNAKATALYHSICRPGTTWEIRGDVAIIRSI